jgi:peptide/nickel transport system substrate-binding protein
MKKSGISYSVTRRRFLRDATLTSLGLVAAACTPGSTGASSSPGTGAKGGEFHGAWPYDLPPKGHYNYFASAGIILQGSVYLDLFIPSLAGYRWADAKWEYWLAESSSLNGNVFEVKLRPNIKWSDGTPFTSKDVVTTFVVGRMDSFKIWNYIDKVEAAGDLTVRFNYVKPSSVGERNILRVAIRPDSVYGAIAKRAADLYTSGKTTSSPELVALRAEKDGLRPDPYSVGPYKIDKGSVTEAQMTMLRNDGGLFADKVNFDKVIIYQGETAQVTPLVLAGDLDYATHGFPLATDKAFVDAGIRVVRPPAYSGPAIVFHWEKAAAFQDKRLRQAVAQAINKDESAKVTYGDSAKAQKFMTGISDNLVPLWISSADQAKLKSYAFDLNAAAALMTAAGYAKGSDGVYAKDGKKLEFELYFPSDFADWSSAADHAQKSLNTFGIKIVPRGAIRSQQLPDVNNGNFQITLMGWGIGSPHPQQSYEQTLQAFNTIPPGGGMKYPLKQGDVDFEALIVQMGEGFDTNKQKDPVTKVALAFNDLLPVVPLWERYGNNPVNDKKRVKGWKPDGDPIYKNAFGQDNFAVYGIIDGSLSKI